MVLQDENIDLIAYDRTGRVVLVAEVRSKIGTSEEWAARFRSNMLEHGGFPRVLFFMIATPERMYFWDHEHQGADALPAGNSRGRRSGWPPS